MRDKYGKRREGQDWSGLAQQERQCVDEAQPLRRLTALGRRHLDAVRAQVRRWGAIGWARFRASLYSSQYQVCYAYDQDNALRHVELGRFVPKVVNRGAVWIERYPMYYGKDWVTHKVLYSEEFSKETMTWKRIK